MNRKLCRVTFWGLLLFATTGLAQVGTGCRTGDCQPNVRVPADFRTIQAAIDASPTGSTIQIASGIYHETLRIEGKQLSLVGADHEQEGITQIIGADSDTAVVTATSGGGGLLKNLDLQGGLYGIAGTGAGDELPSALAIKNTRISNSSRGIWGKFSSLQVDNVQITNISGQGISLFTSPAGGSILLKNLSVSLTGGYCMFLYGVSVTIQGANLDGCHSGGVLAFQSLVTIKNSAVSLNLGPGVALTESIFDIENSSLLFNEVYGIVTHQGGGLVTNTQVWFTLPRDSDGAFGDGIAAWDSALVTVRSSNLRENARAGVSNFGATVKLKSVTLECNPIDLDGEQFGSPPNNPDWPDLGGNVCGCGGETVACQVKSLNLEPPDILTAPEPVP